MLFPKSPYRFNTSQVYSISNMVKHGLNGNGETNLHNKLVVQRKNKKVSFKSYFIPSFFVTFLLFSITLPSTKAEDYPDYEFNQVTIQNIYNYNYQCIYILIAFIH